MRNQITQRNAVLCYRAGPAPKSGFATRSAFAVADGWAFARGVGVKARNLLCPQRSGPLDPQIYQPNVLKRIVHYGHEEPPIASTTLPFPEPIVCAILR